MQRPSTSAWLLCLAAIFYCSVAASQSSILISPPVVAPASVYIQTSGPVTQQAELQKRFELGIIMMDKDIDQAILIFQALYADTKAVRVQLELARSLFVARRLAEAREQFIQVLSQPVPIVVRDKVEWYLSEIQKRQTFKFYVGVYQDSNPGQITAERTFNIFGQTLNYQPSLPTNTQWALNLTAEIEREIPGTDGLFASASLVTSTFSTQAFNKQIGDTSVAKRWLDANYKEVRVGNEFMFYGGSMLYDAPYVSSRMIFNQPDQNFISVSAKAAVLNFPSYLYLNGTQVQTQLGYTYNVLRNWTLSAEVGADRTTAQTDAYSSYGMFAGLGTQIAEDSTGLQLNLKASLSRRNYWSADPIWGLNRTDSLTTFSATLTKRDFYLFGLRPEVGYVYQHNNSNIDFYSYDKGVVGVFLKNVF